MANKAISNEMEDEREVCLKHERSNFLSGNSSLIELFYSIPWAKIMTRPGSKILDNIIIDSDWQSLNIRTCHPRCEYYHRPSPPRLVSRVSVYRRTARTVSCSSAWSPMSVVLVAISSRGRSPSVHWLCVLDSLTPETKIIENPKTQQSFEHF